MSTSRQIRVDGFPYSTTAPKRTRVEHYERLARAARGLARLARYQRPIVDQRKADH